MASSLKPEGSTSQWRRLRAYVLQRDQHTCQLPGSVTAGGAGWSRLYGSGLVCGALATHVDHVLPRIAGGGDELENLRAACASCNLSRGARLDDSATSGSSSGERAGRWEW